MNWQQILVSEYADAIPFNKFAEKVQKTLIKRGFRAENTLFANCICRDEINYRDLNIFTKHWGENFFLAGLGGYPSCGITGFSACLGHVPDNGSLLLLFGPHIGINESGTLGRVHRAGMQQVTNACDALISLTEKVVNKDYQPVFNELDGEQYLLEKGLQDHFTEITAAENSIKTVTEISFSVIQEKLEQIIDSVKPDKPIALIGGITINTTVKSEDFFVLRAAEIIRYTSDGAMDREDILQAYS